jgi:hypothetical protein
LRIGDRLARPPTPAIPSLGGSRIEEDKYPWASPEADLAAARKLIEQCGYWRRKEELEDAEAALLDR